PHPTRPCGRLSELNLTPNCCSAVRRQKELPMPRGPRYLEVEHVGDVFCVRLRRYNLHEKEILELADELVKLIDDDGCRRMVLSLGPESPQVLFSVFLAKLVMIRRRLLENGGVPLKLCDTGEDVRGVFKACQLSDLFEFYPDQASAVASFAR